MILTALDQKYIPLIRKECLDLYPPPALLLHDLLRIRKRYYCIILKIFLSGNSYFASLSDQDKAQLYSHYMHYDKLHFHKKI